MPVFRREISSPDKRFQLGRQPNTHRPAATAGRRLDKRHVNSIDVRTLFAIDLNVHKLAIHDRSDICLFEFLVRHYVAPMTGGISDREEDRFVFLACLRESFFAPRIPIDRIVSVLEKIRRFFPREPVHDLRYSRPNFGRSVWGCHEVILPSNR